MSQPRVRTPHVDKLAKEILTFRRVIDLRAEPHETMNPEKEAATRKSLQAVFGALGS
jgi:hypothetical protein